MLLRVIPDVNKQTFDKPACDFSLLNSCDEKSRY